MSTRVLVVDDDTSLCRAISKVLAREGFDVTTASDVKPALDSASHHVPDLAVVDYNMPTCGLEVVRRLKEVHGERIFIAVLTGEDSEQMRASCLGAGADAVLIKPIAATELRRRLTAAALALKTLPAAS